MYSFSWKLLFNPQIRDLLRFTNDIDVVVDLRSEQVDAFCLSFPSTDFYCYREAVVEAIRQKFQFNIIHFEQRPDIGLEIQGFFVYPLVLP